MTRAASNRKPVVATDAATERTISRAAVAAPGKQHRQPPPQEHADARMGEPEGRKMGQKSMKTAWRGGRTH